MNKKTSENNVDYKDKETFQNLAVGPKFNLFTTNDHTIIRKAISNLEGNEKAVIQMRFWEQNSISEIANILDLSWDEVESCLAKAMEKLKAACLKTPEFSRSEKGPNPLGRVPSEASAA